MSVRIHDIPKITTLSEYRSELILALGELPKDKDRYRIASVTLYDFNVGLGDDSRKSPLVNVNNIPAGEMRIFLEARLAKIEDELINLGVDVT